MSDSSSKGMPARPETPAVDDMAWLDMEAPAGIETPDRNTADDGRPLFAGTGILARNTGLFTDPLDRRQQVERLEDKSTSQMPRGELSVWRWQALSTTTYHRCNTPIWSFRFTHQSLGA